MSGGSAYACVGRAPWNGVSIADVTLPGYALHRSATGRTIHSVVGRTVPIPYRRIGIACCSIHTYTYVG